MASGAGVPLMPWQRPGLLGHVIGGLPLFQTPWDALNLGGIRMMQAPQPPSPQVAPALASPLPPSKRMKVAAAQDEELKRDKLIDSWVMVAGKQLGASRIGRMVEKDVTGPGLAETVRLCFELKATGTLAT
eukprot:2123299-Karenia_brevis.AAC.1